MKKVFFACVILMGTMLLSCGPAGKTTKVVRPRYHTTYATNVYRIDIPIGARHIRFLGRKRTKVVRMH